MILAAGFGTRLRPLTYLLPKPLVPFCNRPLIAWAAESLIAAGVRELVINLHHQPEPLERFMRDRYGSRTELFFSFEEEILGTGGGLRRVRDRLQKEEDFFLANADTVQFPLYDRLREARRAQRAIAALTLRHPPQNDRFTAVWFDDGAVNGFGSGHGEALMFSGVHCIASRIFNELPDRPFSGIVEDAYQPLLVTRRETIAAIVDDNPLWFDIGTPQRYVAATEGLLAAIIRGDVAPPEGSQLREDSLVDRTARIDGTIVRTVVGARSVVDGELRDSAVWDDCTIGGSVLLERCIVGHGVELQGPLELRDAVICRDDASIPSEYARRDGVVIG